MTRYIFSDEDCRYVDINKDTFFFMHRKLVDFLEKVKNSGIHSVRFNAGEDHIELTIKFNLTSLGEFCIFSSHVQDKLKDMHENSVEKCRKFIDFFNSISGEMVYMYDNSDYE